MSPEARLWQEVVLIALADAAIDAPANREVERERDQARRWIARPDPDFRTVCALAGWDSDFIRDSFLSRRIDPALLRTANSRGAQAAALSAPAPRPQAPAHCKVPGCGKALWPRARMGVCLSHNHAVGYCRCRQCERVR